MENITKTSETNEQLPPVAKVDAVLEPVNTSTKSTRWSKESDRNISHPSVVQSKKLPKILVWKDLFVSVPIEDAGGWFVKRKNKSRVILKGVSGVAEPGQILAIMGESGAGKTTLLNVLTQRFKKALKVEGEVNVNGEVLAPSEMRKTSAFVQQFDLFMGSMTVREYLTFCAHLRMGRDFTREERMEKVQEVIEKMGLVKCQDTMIGQRFTKSISLGEKKRLSFACELLNNPPIIFCDEPTSGLDAYMAKQVILCLKNLASVDGCTVVITIHQPSSLVFGLIDRVCFMSCGLVTYLGPTKKVPAFFASIGHDMPPFTNPAEFAIKTLAMKEGEKEIDYGNRIDRIHAAYHDSAVAKDFHTRTHGPVSERRKIFNEDLRDTSRYNSTWCTQFWWLFKRSFFKTLRDPLMIKIRLFHILMTAMFISIIFFQNKISSDTIINVDGLLFNVIRDSFFVYVSPCILVFTDELPIFLRENHNRIYRTDAYFIAKNLAELPQYVILPFIYTTIIYFTTTDAGSYDALKYFQFSFICITATYMALSIAYLAAIVFGRVEIAMQYMPLINFPMLAMSGFFIKLHSIKDYFLPLRYASWFKYTYEAAMINAWYNVKEIKGCELMGLNMTETKLIQCTMVEGMNNGTGHLAYNGFKTELYWVWINIGIIFCMAMLVRALALGALTIRNKITDG